jgi:hypothetical protein
MKERRMKNDEKKQCGERWEDETEEWQTDRKRKSE